MMCVAMMCVDIFWETPATAGLTVKNTDMPLLVIKVKTVIRAHLGFPLLFLIFI